MEFSVQKLKQTLKEAGSSATKSRVLIFTTLQQGPQSISQLAKASASQADRATVYRTVELFEKLGIVNRIWHGFKHHIELSEIFTPHHHHASCQNCGRITDLTSTDLESVLSALAKKHRFLALSHSVELTGYCNQCQGQ